MRWKTYFYFTTQERRGITVLMTIVAILVVVRIALARTVAAHEDLSPLQTQMAQADSIFVQDSLASTQVQSRFRSTRASATGTGSNKPVRSKPRTQKTRERVELNSADTTRLKQLRGIGSGYARMIVNYRKRLGGFYHKEQLLEVYHFPRETFEKIEWQLQVDTSLIVPLRINSLELEELKRHPYIRYFQAKSLVENRKKRPDGRYHSLQDIPLDQDVTLDFLEKVRPYLSFQ